MKISATEGIQKIQDAAQLADGTTRVIETMEAGQAVRQGDVYLHRVADTHPHGEVLQSRQLAVGTTRGARHFAESPATVYEGTTPPPCVRDRVFLGPCVVAPKRIVVSHPEHPDYSLPPGTYQVTHQMDVATQQRVRD